jgi:hypothetical protein
MLGFDARVTAATQHLRLFAKQKIRPDNYLVATRGSVLLDAAFARGPETFATPLG